MRTGLIGHRGVGKTSMLARITNYYRDAGRDLLTLDLDAEIARKVGSSVGKIFQTSGEDEFRRLERKVFAEIDLETAEFTHDVYVSLGAGFELSCLPKNWHALWVRRASDLDGRIFVDPFRPRLSQALDPLAEFHQRFAAREKNYRARANEILFIDEGLENVEKAERDFFLNSISELGGALTLLPEVFRGEKAFSRWCQRRLAWGVKWFEIRDDLLNEEQIAQAVTHLPHVNLLVSFRAVKTSVILLRAVQAGCAYDWPVERGPCPYGQPTVLSLHERFAGQSVTEALSRLRERADVLLKAALPVDDFRELAEGHKWMMEAPERRTFLPMSTDGRWSCYRLLMAPFVPLSFFREDEGSGVDQPTLLQWIRRRQIFTDPLYFAAVLGDPVAHSRSPLEQSEFFKRWKIPFVSIRMTEREWQDGAIEFLRTLGLRWAAVTAPLKSEAFELSRLRESMASELTSVNTLYWDCKNDCWHGDNTDQMGFRALIDGEVAGAVAIWGGGGTLAMLKSALPQAECFSVRTGENRDRQGVRAEKFRPTTVIWAAGKLKSSPGAPTEPAAEPPVEWRPSAVIDLNYFEDSLGREFALRWRARYISGLKMFRVQAEGQRAFWLPDLQSRRGEGK
jgi:shikimate 5-dehydrogenase/shikimate kinase